MDSIYNIKLEELKLLAEKAKKANKSLIKKIKNRPPKNLDTIIHNIHNQLFVIDKCISCANCCKSISPTLYHNDINRLAKYLKIRPAEFMDKYIMVDSDNDYVFKITPCPFLDSDNYCKIYDARPKACREYPHTDRKKMYQILDITLKNTYICPAVYRIIELLKQNLSKNINE